MHVTKIRDKGNPLVERLKWLDKIYKIKVNKVFCFYLLQHTRRSNCVERNTRKHLFTNCVNNLCKELPHDMQPFNSIKSIFIWSHHR